MAQNVKDETKVLGPDYDFFERYLTKYYQSNVEGELIIDSANATSKKFYDLINEYDNSKSENGLRRLVWMPYVLDNMLPVRLS